jgi:hypothetical protein
LAAGEGEELLDALGGVVEAPAHARRAGGDVEEGLAAVTPIRTRVGG